MSESHESYRTRWSTSATFFAVIVACAALALIGDYRRNRGGLAILPLAALALAVVGLFRSHRGLR